MASFSNISKNVLKTNAAPAVVTMFCLDTNPVKPNGHYQSTKCNEPQMTLYKLHIFSSYVSCEASTELCALGLSNIMTF